MGLNQLDISARLVEDRLMPFVRKITAAALPNVPGAKADFYLEIEAIRCAGVTKLCNDWLERYRVLSGDDLSGSARHALDSVRTELLRIYPACAAMLDLATWPANRQH